MLKLKRRYCKEPHIDPKERCEIMEVVVHGVVIKPTDWPPRTAFELQSHRLKKQYENKPLPPLPDGADEEEFGDDDLTFTQTRTITSDDFRSLHQAQTVTSENIDFNISGGQSRFQEHFSDNSSNSSATIRNFSMAAERRDRDNSSNSAEAFASTAPQEALERVPSSAYPEIHFSDFDLTSIPLPQSSEPQILENTEQESLEIPKVDEMPAIKPSFTKKPSFQSYVGSIPTFAATFPRSRSFNSVRSFFAGLNSSSKETRSSKGKGKRLIGCQVSGGRPKIHNYSFCQQIESPEHGNI